MPHIAQAPARTATRHTLDPRLRVLAELRAATLTRCEFCVDLGSAIAHRGGITDAERLALAEYGSSPLFSGTSTGMRGRFTLALGVGSSGLASGTVCALPPH